MRSSRDMEALRPDVAANCRIWHRRCQAAGLRVLVTNTVRDGAYQEYLYQQGRTRPGAMIRAGKLPPLMPPAEPGEEEEDPMDVKEFSRLWREMRQGLQDNDSSAYSAEARQWAVKRGLVAGGGEENYMWEDVMTREQMVTVLYRFARQAGLLD